MVENTHRHPIPIRRRKGISAAEGPEAAESTFHEWRVGVLIRRGIFLKFF
jgi:hypothetical protein